MPRPRRSLRVASSRVAAVADLSVRPGRPERRQHLLRPRRADDLGLKRALSDRLLPLLVAAMVFLAALAIAASVAASGLAARFEWGAGATLTVQVPKPATPSAHAAQSRADAVEAILSGTHGLAARKLGQGELNGLLKPWLGDDTARLALDMPAVFEVRLLPAAAPPASGDLADRLRDVAPGTLIEHNEEWFGRLAALAGSLQACAALGLLVVTFVATAVIAVATRAGLAVRRDAIEIVHGLGATDSMIAGRFARRVTLLAFGGAVLGLVLAVPMLLGLASLAAPFRAGPGMVEEPADSGAAFLARLPLSLWELLPLLPVAAALIGWTTAHATVRRWLGRLT